MRLVIILVFALLLQGCGHKGPLKLPAPQAQTSQDQATSQQKPDVPSAQQDPSTK